MGHAKKTIYLIVVSLVLVGLSFFLHHRDKAGPQRLQPLAGTVKENILKVTIVDPSVSVVLENQNHQWHIVSPINDIADSQTMNSMLDALIAYSVGDVVTESQDKHSLFQVTEGSGTHVSVFVQNTSTPTVQFLTGKQASGYGSCYYRLANDSKVSLAYGLPSWIFLTPAEQYRQRSLFGFMPQDINEITVTKDKEGFELIKSSANWTDRKSGQAIDSQSLQPLLKTLSELTIDQFMDPSKSDPKKQGFSNPYMTIQVGGPFYKVHAMIGNQMVQVTEKMTNQRFAQVDGRDKVLLISSAPIDEVLKYLKAVSKK